MIWLVAAAMADPCAAWQGGIAMGPVEAGLLDGDLGEAHRACTRTDAGFGGSAYLLADTANFYGHLVGGGHFSASYVFAADTEAFVDLELVRYDSVLAPIGVSYFGVGYSSAGVAHTVWRSDTLALSLNGKGVMPTAVGLTRNAWPISADFGAAGIWSLGEHIEIHGQVGVLGTVAVGGPALPAAGARLTLGTEWRPGKAFAFAIDGVAGFGYIAPLDVIAVAPAFRFGIGRAGHLALEATVPLAGAERALATVDLNGGVRFR